ncbi:MAG: C1 family peptidase [Thiohalospira sp.]
MKKIFTLLILVILSVKLFSQKFEKAPLNEEFKKEINKKAKKTGYIPSPTYYVFSDKINEEIAKISFPETFDLRDEGLVTSVKNQGGAGHCWSFSALGAVESRSLVLGSGNYDLSEKNMATCHGFEWEEGGNQSIATAYMTRLQGPILESEDPYDDNDFECTAEGITPQFYVSETYFLPRNSDLIKYILMNYGAIAVSYHHNDSYYNSTDKTYYYPGNDGPNHGVLLTGWDETKETEGGTGAWIIKNSWGSYWGDNGYFYMSYNDTHALENATIYPKRQEINEIDTILMYDYFGEVTSYGFSDFKDYALVKYNVSEEHTFNKIATYVGASNSYIDIEVFKTKDGNSLTDTLAKAYNFFVEHPGYHTFSVPFTTSGDIYIKIGYYTPNDDYPIPVEYEIADYVYPDIEENVGWISNHGDEWSPIGSETEYPFDLCIRAYGTRENIKAGFSSNYTTICNDSEVLFTNQSAGDIENYYWDFGEDASPATSTLEDSIKVTYSSEGFKTIKLVVENASEVKDSIVSYNYLNVSSEINVNITPYSNYYLPKGDTIELVANGAETYQWTPADLIIGNATDATIKVSPDSDTTLFVEGTIGSCSNTDSVRIIVIEAPENDDVCDAIELVLDTELGPFTNANATVQENEPHPPLGDCEAPGYWCDEGGLHNSVWFTFTAPNSGAVKIETDGFDNQIAVWEADSCENITSGVDSLYQLIAANDDYDDPDYSATIEEITGLEPGKTYWLQMDGSAGGDEGECTILITSLENEYDSPCDAKSLNYLTLYNENNYYATVHPDEPMPDDSDCNSQNSWCPGDTLNATVWFKFTATATEEVSIESSGFDNQIAVYSTNNCEDLLSGNSDNYIILAANDNYEENNYASIYEITNLVEGNEYYIQVDGKNDNFYGEFTLYLKEWPLSTEEMNKALEGLKIYPNPNTGQFKVDLSGLNNLGENPKIQIINADGSLLKQIEGVKNKKEYELSIEREGLFMIRVISNNNYYTQPIIVK